MIEHWRKRHKDRRIGEGITPNTTRKKYSDPSIDRKSNVSHSINSNSTSSIEINTGKIHEVVKDENINEDVIIDDYLVIKSPPQ